jgi:DNA processing protein
MSAYQENTYWIAIAHLPRWPAARINQLIIRVWHELGLSWPEFFDNNKNGLREIFAFTEKELDDLALIKKDLPRIAFLAEQLHNEGFELIPISSKAYSAVLKENFKAQHCPPLLYIKGRRTILQEEAVAIVGSRDAGENALLFTDTIAKKCVLDFKVIVSGFAKGVDKQALDSTLAANGKSIIVLPQGILTFQSGFKQYYEPIVNGEALVLSTFYPTAGWEVGLAMARNTYIYGLAKEIYVAESDSKGGTWEGAMDGLRRKRKVYVRWPESNEENANRKLVEMGAIPINMMGEPVAVSMPRQKDLFDTDDSSSD